MKTITYDKLVRDKIPEIIEADGKTCETEILPDKEYLEALDAKLDEELAEYHKDQNVEELADLLEVIYACAKARGCSLEELESIRKMKAEKRGGFEKKILLKTVTDNAIETCDSGAKKKFIRDRSGNLHLSLHDSRIQKMEVHENTLQLTMDRIFQYTDEEKSYRGVIEFTKVDVEECSILVFDHPYGYEGETSFSGLSYSLTEYNDRYPNAEFEIVTEGYNGYDTCFQGWIWDGELGPLFGIMNIWNMGDMVYLLED